MKAPKQLRKPDNWQDFEKLCKKLFGEIWNDPEIKKNGRNGQYQAGVDIYGIPRGENGYYGIQCKGRKVYKKQTFSQEEILREVKKAESFEPALKKFYLVTTAEKDVKIERYVRQINIERKALGLFEVHIFSWEDLVDFIEENPNTFDYYVNSQNYKNTKNVQISFKNGELNLKVFPKFKQKITYYRLKMPEIDLSFLPNFEKLRSSFAIFDSLPRIHAIKQASWYKKTLNHSYFPISFTITNAGTLDLENMSLTINYIGKILDIKRTNIKEEGAILLPKGRQYTPDIYFEVENQIINIEPHNAILVGRQTYETDPIYIKVDPNEEFIKFNWTFLSSGFNKEGQLKIEIKSEVEKDVNRKEVETKEEEKTVEAEITDNIEIIEER